MFDIGFLELLVVGIVALLVLGPERLPKAARTAGLWIGKIKRTVSGMQREISSQLEAEELRQKLKEQQSKLDESLDRAKRDVESIAEPISPSLRRKKPNDSETSQAQAGDEPPRQPASSRLDDALANAQEAPEKTSDKPSSTPDDKKDAASR